MDQLGKGFFLLGGAEILKHTLCLTFTWACLCSGDLMQGMKNWDM